MSQRFAIGVEQFASEILRFGDDQAEGGAHDRVPHLFGHRDEAAPHDLE
jgi:hypothetical protein